MDTAPVLADIAKLLPTKNLSSSFAPVTMVFPKKVTDKPHVPKFDQPACKQIFHESTSDIKQHQEICSNVVRRKLNIE